MTEFNTSSSELKCDSGGHFSFKLCTVLMTVLYSRFFLFYYVVSTFSELLSRFWYEHHVICNLFKLLYCIFCMIIAGSEVTFNNLQLLKRTAL